MLSMDTFSRGSTNISVSLTPPLAAIFPINQSSARRTMFCQGILILGHLNQLVHPFTLPHHLSGTPSTLAKVSAEAGRVQQEKKSVFGEVFIITYKRGAFINSYK